VDRSDEYDAGSPTAAVDQAISRYAKRQTKSIGDDENSSLQPNGKRIKERVKKSRVNPPVQRL
jgi:hypothetical protein